MYFIPVYYSSYLVLEVNTQFTAITARKQMSSPEQLTKQFHMFAPLEFTLKEYPGSCWRISVQFYLSIIIHKIDTCAAKPKPIFLFRLLWFISILPAVVLWRNASLPIDCTLSMEVFAEVPLFNLFWVGIERLLSRNVALDWKKNTVLERKVRGNSSEKWSCATFNAGHIKRPI